MKAPWLTIASKEKKLSNSVGAVHYWVRGNFEPAKTCELCGVPNDGTRVFQWSNKNHTYKRVREDWQHVCCSCHIKYDYKHNGSRAGKRVHLPNNKWARYYDACIYCGGTESKHIGNGSCLPCAMRHKRIETRLKNYGPTGIGRRRTRIRKSKIAA